MKLFYGLGNNENKYLDTKHNIGRIIVENLAQKFSLNFSDVKGCYIAKSSDCWFVHTNGYMNNCGEPLSELLKYYKVDVATDFDLIIVQDDSDQIAGNTKLMLGGGTAGHNGIISVYREIAFLGLEQARIWRLKVGIRPEGNKLRSETFVLSKNSIEDKINVLNNVNKLFANIELVKNLDDGKLQKILNTK